MKNIVSCDKISKSYGFGNEKNKVLDNISIEIKEGEFTAIMGPSGSGKSTLLFALSGMDDVDSGYVVFDGANLSELSENARADMRRLKMGFVFQQPTLLKNLNIIDNIILPSMRDNKRHNKELVKKAKELMKKTGISELESRDTTQVSGGQLQRAGICRALMNNPKIIFADEPTGALNSQSAQEIMDILRKINAEGTAMLIVTHDANIAAQAKRVIFMRDGKIACEILLDNTQNEENNIHLLQEKMREIGI